MPLNQVSTTAPHVLAVRHRVHARCQAISPRYEKKHRSHHQPGRLLKATAVLRGVGTWQRSSAPVGYCRHRRFDLGDAHDAPRPTVGLLVVSERGSAVRRSPCKQSRASPLNSAVAPRPSSGRDACNGRHEGLRFRRERRASQSQVLGGWLLGQPECARLSETVLISDGARPRELAAPSPV